MPPVVVAVAAAAAANAIATSAVVIAALGSIGAAVAGAVVGAVISYVGALAFAKKPKTADLSSLGSGLSNRSQMVRQPIVSRKIVYGEVAASGPVTYLNVTNGNRKLSWLITLSGHPVEAIGDVWFGDTVAFKGEGTGNAIGKYAGYATIWKGDGTPAGDAALLAQMRATNSEWTVNHKQEGCAKLYIEFTYDQDVYAGGIPQVKCLVKGKNDIYDPRTETTGYTDNWALVTADYVASDIGISASIASVLEDDLIVAANVADEEITLAAGGTEKRYITSGVVDTEVSLGDNLRELINPGAGLVVNTGGYWSVLAGAYRTPEYTIDESWLAGPIRVRLLQSKRDLFNTMHGVYSSRDTLWQPTDLPVLKSDVFIAQDGGQEIPVDREYLYTPSAPAGQRLQKIGLFKNRQQGEVDLQCNLKAMALRVGDVVLYSRSVYGWDEKPFEVIAWDWAIREEEDNVHFGVDITIRETSAETYDWSTDDETIVAASSISTLPGPGDVATPDGLDVTEVQYQTREGGGVKSKAVLSAGVADDAFVVSYQFEHRQIGVLDWTVYPRVTDPELEIFDIPAGVYDFRVKAVNRLGASSGYVSLRREIYGLGGKPSAATGLTISALGGLAVLRWDRSPDLDVRMGGQVRFRWSPANSNPLVSESATIGAPVPGGDTMAVLPLKPGCYLLQFVDGSGSVSDATWVSTDGATVLEYGAVDELVESPAWSGDLDNLTVDDGSLKLVGSGMFDDIPVFDDVASLDAFGGIVASGLYTHASGHDFTTKSRRVISASVTLQTINVIDLFDQREGTVDSWASFDGETSGEGDAITWYRTTDDDPAGSPSWSSWQRLDRAEVYCRAVQYRTEVTVSDGSYNVLITDLRVRAESLS
ncbi:phage tail protein [Thalassospira sp. SM2505]